MSTCHEGPRCVYVHTYMFLCVYVMKNYVSSAWAVGVYSVEDPEDRTHIYLALHPSRCRSVACTVHDVY
jgi:hypothetical protein